MKKSLCIFSLLFTVLSFAQDNGVTYQAVIYSTSGESLPGRSNLNSPLVNKSICLQFSIINESTQTEYQEKITVTTDDFGMVNLIIGTGTQTGGYANSFNAILWSNSKKYLQVGLDQSGNCSTFEKISYQVLSYVPFAFAAKSTTSVSGIVAVENGGTNASSVAEAKTNLQLQNVNNTSDLNKPISTATQATLNTKVDKVTGKELSTNDYTTAEKTKLAAITGSNTGDQDLSTLVTVDLLASKASISSPTFTGIPLAPTAAIGTNNTQIATTEYVDAAVSAGTATGTSSTPDATASVKGKLQLAGDLAGTADAPTVAALAINTSKIADNAITTVKISDLTITAAKIANSAVTTAKILDANVTTVKILDANVTTAKILDANVTTAKIADANVTTAKILDANVTTAKIADASVTTAKILDANVTTVKILDANVTTAKIADANITTTKIADFAVTGAKVAAGTISNTNLANVPSKTFKGRTDAADGVVQDLTIAQVRTDLAINLVDNTSDASKPVSTATQTALDLKATINSPSFTGTPTAVTAALGTNSTQIATTAYVDAANRTIFSTRVNLSSAATPAPIGSSLFNYYTLTAQAEVATFEAPSGTPLDGNSLVIKIKANGAEIPLAWNAIYRGGTDISLPTITNKTVVLHFMYNTADAKWDLVGITNGI